MSLELIGTKIVTAIYTQTAATNGTAAGTVDTAGYAFAKVLVNLGALNATNSVPTVCKTTWSNDVTGPYVTIEGHVSGTDYTLPSSYPNTTATTLSATTPLYFSQNIDLRGGKRYLKLEVTPGTSNTITGLVLLGDPYDYPTSTTDVNALVSCTG